MYGKTITTFIPNTEESSVVIKTVSNSIIRAVGLPRNLIEKYKDRIDLKRACLYFLFGNDEKTLEPSVYIGEAGNAFERLQRHENSAKFEWSHALVISSSTEGQLLSTATKYLENHSYMVAKTIGRYKVYNSVTPPKPMVPESLEASLLESFEIIRLVMEESGYNLFKPLIEIDSKLLYINRKGIKATGEYTSEGFVVLRGSEASIEIKPCLYHSIVLLREKLLETGVMIRKEGIYVFEKDHLFPTPSSAAETVLGVVASGWTEWKDEGGRTLKVLWKNGDK
ncbi:GIY-YIG nuclease family protein [Sediminitomix flava]|uniref:Uncharacterized protein DUF4357 n=1 Tax=Sediminitomix flava TaxID=379075 RepID=A0A315ZFE8_SEDFL|nr:GIY-YIG nuclease family protein [Sediminitomix flava]PWJ43880.1 uncharacterized protein DUF4357 [Sediminitomix flava]